MARYDTHTHLRGAGAARLSADRRQETCPQLQTVRSAVLRHGTGCCTSAEGCRDIQGLAGRRIPVSVSGTSIDFVSIILCTVLA